MIVTIQGREAITRLSNRGQGQSSRFRTRCPNPKVKNVTKVPECHGLEVTNNWLRRLPIAALSMQACRH